MYFKVYGYVPNMTVNDGHVGSARMRSEAWVTRLLVGLTVSGALFQTACIGRSQVYDTPLAPGKPVIQRVSATHWPLRIASYNVWILPWFSEEYDERLAKLPGALVALDPDIVILQEVWSGAARDEISKALGPAYVTARCDGGGLMVLSRLPIRSERFTPFGFDCDLSVPEWFAKKGVMEVVLDTPVGPLRVINAHLALPSGAAEGQARQLLFLLDRIEASRELPLIVGADLNIAANYYAADELNPDYLCLIDAGLRDLDPPVLVRNGYAHPAPTRVGWPRPTPFAGWHPDHLMVRDGLAGSIRIKSFRLTLDTPETALSDHNLLLGEIVIGRK